MIHFLTHCNFYEKRLLSGGAWLLGDAYIWKKLVTIEKCAYIRNSTVFHYLLFTKINVRMGDCDYTTTRM